MAKSIQKPAIYISYAWGSESEAIAERIEKEFEKRELPIIRDKKALSYKGRIKAFMERIGRADYIILVISDKYLRSANCMFELIQIFKNEHFYERVFPVVLDEVDIYDPGERVQLMKYWEDKTDSLNDQIRELKDFTNIQGVDDDLNLISEIRDNIARLTNILKDTNTLSIDSLVASNFEPLFAAVQDKVKNDGEKAPIINGKQETPGYYGADSQNIFVRIKAKLFGTTAFFEVADKNKRRVISFGITAILGICAIFLALPQLFQNASDEAISDVETPVIIAHPDSNKIIEDSLYRKERERIVEKIGTPIANTRYNVELFVPSNMADAAVFVDGKPAEIVDRSLISITVRLRKKNGSHHFEIKDGDKGCKTDKLITEDNVQLTLCE